jgi:DNA-binding winged helix-turn-helix (wHTH) protein
MSRALPSTTPTPGAESPRRRVQFAIFTFDSRTRQVIAGDGETLHLTPKAFDLLDILIARAPHVVRKSELHERLWPATFVSDAALAALVKELRHAFHARMPATQFIRTAHSVGFAFCATLTPHEPPDSTATRQWLIVRNRRLALKEGENIIGRDPESDVWLDGPSVSRRHARIVVDGTRARIEDLGSKNGTRLGNDGLTVPAPLRDGDQIHIGRVAIVYRDASSDRSTESMRDPPTD